MAKQRYNGVLSPNNTEYPIFEWDVTDSEIVTVSASSAGDVLPSPVSPGDVIRVVAEVATHFRLGAGAQTAVVTDPLLTAGVHYIVVPALATNFAGIESALATGGVLTVTALKTTA